MQSGRLSGLWPVIAVGMLITGCATPGARTAADQPVADTNYSTTEGVANTACRASASCVDSFHPVPLPPADDTDRPTVLGAPGGRTKGAVQLASLEDDADDLVQPVASPPESVGTPAAGLNLEAVIEMALRANPDVHSALAQIDVADAALDRARAEFFPKLGFAELYGVTDNPVRAFMFVLNQAQFSLANDFNHPKVTDDFDTQLRVEHRLYAGGRRQAEARAAADQLAAAECSLAAVQNQLVFRVAEAYYRLLQARDLVGVRQEAVVQVQRQLDMVRQRFRAETAVQSDVLSVQVRLAEVREALITAQNMFELGWSVLANVSGVAIARQPLPAAIPPAPWTNHVARVQDAVAEAMGRRPELTMMANQRAAAAHGVDAARAGKRVTVDFVTDYDVFTGDFRQGNDSFFTGLVLQLNLFDGGRTSSEVCRALARVHDLEARRQRLALDIQLDVRQAYLRLNDAQQRLTVATQAIDQARTSLREIEVRYRGQAVTVVQLIDAQVALSNARVRQANARAEVEIARVALERAIGRLTRFVGS